MIERLLSMLNLSKFESKSLQARLDDCEAELNRKEMALREIVARETPNAAHAAKVMAAIARKALV